MYLDAISPCFFGEFQDLSASVLEQREGLRFSPLAVIVDDDVDPLDPVARTESNVPLGILQADTSAPNSDSHS